MRDVFIDIAKGIAILLVVRIHTECFWTLPVPYPKLAVPLFFFISGIYDRSCKPITSVFLKNFKSLIIPSLIWPLIHIFFYSSLHSIKNHTFGLAELHISMERPFLGYGATWFLVALFYSKIFTALLVKSKINKYFIWIITILLGWVACKHNFPLLLDEGLTALPFYFLGSLLTINTIKTIACRWEILFVGIIAFITVHTDRFPYTLVNLDTTSKANFYPLYYIFVCISFIPLIKLCIVLENTSIGNVFSKIGRRTMGILVVHGFYLHTCAITLNRLFIPRSTIWYLTFFMLYIVVCIISYYSGKIMDSKLPILVGKI